MSESKTFVEFDPIAGGVHASWLNAVDRAVLAARVIIANRTLDSTDGLVLANTAVAGAPITAFLEPSPADGRVVEVGKVGGSAYEFIVNGNGNNIVRNGTSSSTLRTGTTVTDVRWRLRYFSDVNAPAGWHEV